MGNQSNFSIMAAEAFCKAVDERCMQSIDVSAFKNVSLSVGAALDTSSFKLQADLSEFIKPDGNTQGIV